MRIFAVWLGVGILIGCIGVMIGPGIVTFAVAVLSALVGAITHTTMKAIGHYATRANIAVASFGIGLLIASPWLMTMDLASILIIGIVHIMVSILGALLSFQTNGHRK